MTLPVGMSEHKNPEALSSSPTAQQPRGTSTLDTENAAISAAKILGDFQHLPRGPGGRSKLKVQGVGSGRLRQVG